MTSKFHPNHTNKCISHIHFGEMWNNLPDRVKNYICDLEQRADPAGKIQMIGSLTEQRDALIEKNNELKELLREFIMRKQCAFPENDADIYWWHAGLSPDLIPKFFTVVGIGSMEIPFYPVLNAKP
jgi:hypothetical protein